MTNSRVTRARQTEEAVAAWFRDNGWPGAERNPASLSGVDILGMPGFAIEVKARRSLDLPAWLKQASTRPGLPMVIHRPDGFGPERIGLWPVTFRLADVTPVLMHWNCDEHCSCAWTL